MTEFLNVAGGRTAYDISRPPTLLTRGPGHPDGARQAYRFLAPQRTGAGYRAAVTDMRGHGEASANWPSRTRTGVAGDILALTGHRGGPAAYGQLLRRYPGGRHEAVLSFWPYRCDAGDSLPARGPGCSGRTRPARTAGLQQWGHHISAGEGIDGIAVAAGQPGICKQDLRSAAHHHGRRLTEVAATSAHPERRDAAVGDHCGCRLTSLTRAA